MMFKGNTDLCLGVRNCCKRICQGIVVNRQLGRGNFWSVDSSTLGGQMVMRFLLKVEMNHLGIVKKTL